MSNKRITIKELAKLSNTSVSTVHRALHDSPDIKEEKKQAIKKLAKELDYEPDSIAQSMVSKQSKLIGVMVPTIRSIYFSNALTGMTDVANEAGYHIIFSQSNENEKDEFEGVKRLVASHVDGLLVSVSKSTKSTKAFDYIKSKGVPLVMYDRVLDNVECNKIIVDEYEGAYKAVEYLIKKKCKRIAHVAGPQNISVCKNRLQGYLDALKQYGLKVDEESIAYASAFEANALSAIKKLFSGTRSPDGIFLVNDLSAIIAVKYIASIGKKVPRDVQIIGFDNSPVCSIFEPNISTVMQPAYEVGKLAMGTLIEELKEKNKVYHALKLRTKLIIRDTTK